MTDRRFRKPTIDLPLGLPASWSPRGVARWLSCYLSDKIRPSYNDEYEGSKARYRVSRIQPPEEW